MANNSSYVRTCDTAELWHRLLEEGSSSESKLLVVVDCTAPWCGPCKFMDPFFEELSGKFQNALFLRIDVDQLKDIAAELEIQGFPTFVLFENGKEVERVLGANKEELERRISARAN